MLFFSLSASLPLFARRRTSSAPRGGKAKAWSADCRGCELEFGPQDCRLIGDAGESAKGEDGPTCRRSDAGCRGPSTDHGKNLICSLSYE
nr:unnamed protein product [Digitaria exilis]